MPKGKITKEVKAFLEAPSEQFAENLTPERVEELRSSPHPRFSPEEVDYFLSRQGSSPQSIRDLIEQGFGIGARIRESLIGPRGEIMETYEGTVIAIREDVFLYRPLRKTGPSRWVSFDGIERGIRNIEVLRKAKDA